MRILVVGAGSTGGYFGGRLAEAGRDVTFLVRPSRAEALRAGGLEIVSPHGDVTLAPKLATAGGIDGPFDLVLLTVKGFALEAALDDIAPAIGPETAIVPVLNGMKHLDTIVARFGAGALVGGVCKVAATLDGEGRIVQLAGFQELVYGELGGGASDRTARIHAALGGAGFEARVSTGIVREMWEKWILLASLGGITCLMRGDVGAVAAAPGGAAFARRLVDEVATVAVASGQRPSEGFVAHVKASLTQPGSKQTSSMYRDLVAGRPVEADQILGDLIARADRLGVETPLVAAAFANLSVYMAGLAT